MNISELFMYVGSTAGNVGKVKLLSENRNNTLDEIFDYAYNPNKKFGVTSNQVAGKTIAKLNDLDIGQYWGCIKRILDLLSNKELTGSDAKREVLRICEFLNPQSQQILFNILDKNLKIGISFDSYQKNVMGIKPTKFLVPLAFLLDEVKNVNPIDGTWYASRKCDGVRCVAFVDVNNDSVIFKFRSGKEIKTLDNLKPEVLRFVKGLGICRNVIALDGELCRIDENGDEHFEEIVGECKKKNFTLTDCCYQLFDIVPAQWFDGIDIADISFDTRYKQLKTLEEIYNQEPHGDCFVKILEQELITSQDDFKRWENKVEVGNWEGFMLRKNAGFKLDRNKDLLKVKKFCDAEYEVTGIECGEFTSAEPGKGNVTLYGVKALLINHKGNVVHVGGGLTKEQRLEWSHNSQAIVGKTIIVKYFQESRDKEGNYSLRFPTLKYVYENGRIDI